MNYYQNMIHIFLGIFIGYVLFVFFIKSKKVIYRGPNSKDIKNKIYKNKSNKKCYVFEPKIYLCGK